MVSASPILGSATEANHHLSPDLDGNSLPQESKSMTHAATPAAAWIAGLSGKGEVMIAHDYHHCDLHNKNTNRSLKVE